MLVCLMWFQTDDINVLTKGEMVCLTRMRPLCLTKVILMWFNKAEIGVLNKVLLVCLAMV